MTGNQATPTAGATSDTIPLELRDPAFPPAMRGYDREVVDRYVQTVNTLLAEVQVSASPKAAVRHALARAGEQTEAMLRQAGATADDITSTARDEAEALLERARRDADEIMAAARRDADDVLTRAKAAADEIMHVASGRADALLPPSRTPAGERPNALDELRRIALLVGQAAGRAPAHRRRRAGADGQGGAGANGSGQESRPY